MSKYKIYLNTEYYSEINEIDESDINNLIIHFRRFRKGLMFNLGSRNNKDHEESAKFIMSYFDNLDNSQPLLFNDITVNHVDNKIEINCM